VHAAVDAASSRFLSCIVHAGNAGAMSGIMEALVYRW